MIGPKADWRADEVSESTNPLTGMVPDTAAPPTATPPPSGTLKLPELCPETSAGDCPELPSPLPPSMVAVGRNDPPLLPRSFGDYELLEVIARGGMGVVYKARQKGLDRLVALKMILPGSEVTPSQLERFAREARAAAALDHPNIVPVNENGCQDGHPFFTMALIDGVSLQQQVQKNGPPEPREAVRLLRAVAEALSYAHEHGVVHRDLKPHNVLVDRSGRPRVADFGLARRTQEVQPLTNAGDVLGTPHYMAPEQAMGQLALLGPTVDVYGLGGILYFLLTGQPPFSGGNVVSIICCVLDQPPKPPHEINPDVPLELEAICLRCLEKHPGRRYPTAAALGEALANWEAQQESGRDSVTPERPLAPPRPGPTPQWGRRLVFGAAGVLGVGGILLALLLWAAGQPNTEVPANPPVSMPELPKDLRHDFALKVELVGGSEGPDGLRVFKEDEPARFLIETEQDAYVGIWTIGPDGTVVQLFPNAYERDHGVRARQPRVVPGNERYTMEAKATPSGKAEMLRVVAATRRWEPLEGEKAGPFVILRGGRQQLEDHLRGIEIRPKAKAEPAAQDGVAEEVLLYQVLRR
jgi:serine/threonine protein kinase